MAATKALILPTLCVFAFLLVSLTQAQSPTPTPPDPIGLINTFMKPIDDPATNMKIGPNLPTALMNSLPPTIQSDLNSLSVKDIKSAAMNVSQVLQDLKNGKIKTVQQLKDALKNALNSVNPQILQTLKDMKQALINALQKLQSKLTPKLANLVQMILNILSPPPPPPAGTDPPPSPLKKLMDKIKAMILKFLNKVDPDRSITQSIANALAKAFPNTMQPLLAKPSLDSFLGITGPPPPPPPPPSKRRR